MSKQSKQSKSTIVEGDETKKTHWLDGSGVKKPTGYGGRARHGAADCQGSGDITNTAATSKFPWTSMRSSVQSQRCIMMDVSELK
ncbi:hypothetical protein L1987_46377 [Smallanthus sonchifolius]|uniref:Uncharacterized protein n=1 Tax=Smallanthus sonchifolius TaxID=185202 RepID=A0ACB9G0L8_9ASTR|nr:hypothetical protein L1987_46377 [Smallanthus sonchifolius]